MALNFVTSYTFSPNTVISSSEVNTNFSDIASVFQGLEAVTKSFARLQVDATPTVAADVVRKDYVDHYSAYRRPVLKWNASSTVDAESGLAGTSGQVPIQFPDGLIRTATTTTMYRFDITRNCVLTSATGQSGLRATLSEAGNTWYALYAVAFTDSDVGWVLVGDTVLPVQASYATINTNFGTNKWVYLGLIRNGDNAGATQDILDFAMAGNTTLFKNTNNGGSVGIPTTGIRFADTGGATTLTYTYAAGTGTTSVPAIITHAYWSTQNPAVAAVLRVFDAGAARRYVSVTGASNEGIRTHLTPATEGVQMTNSAASSIAYDICFAGFIDGVLGVGSNPIL